jgi:hypothetical protein
MINLKLSGITLALAFAFATAAQAQSTQTAPKRDAADKPRTEQTTSDRKAKDMEEERIEAQAKAEKAKCDPMKGNAKDICMAEAKGKEKVAKAELDAKYEKGDQAKAQKKVADMKAEAAYEVAKQRCDDQKGEAKDACQKQARVERDRAKGKAEKTAERTERPAATGTTAPDKPKKTY